MFGKEIYLEQESIITIFDIFFDFSFINPFPPLTRATNTKKER